MRLGQWARKFDVTPQEIIEYLKSKGIEANPHPNSKLDEAAEKLVVEHFDILLENKIDTQSTTAITEATDEVEPEKPTITTQESIEISEESAKEEVASEQTEEPTITEDPTVANVEEEHKEVLPENQEGVIETATETVEEPTNGTDQEAPERNATKTITVGDLLENEEDPVEFDLVKAPKVSLAGLKVVGKIDLPEPKPKSETDPKPQKEKKEYKGRKPLSEAEREKRRLRAKQKKQEYEDRKKRREKKAAAKKLKAAKQAHYHSKIKEKPDTKLKSGKKNKKGKNAASQPSKPAPKTIFGKFWRWLNT